MDSNSPCLGTGLNGDDMGAHGVGCDRIVWHVSTSGSDVDDGNPGSPFASIQEGINAGSDGDTVMVEDGTYMENVNYSGKNIAVLGENRETTIIDGDSSDTVVIFEGGEDATAILDGFTIRNGNGGILCSGNSSPVISNNYIMENTGINGGGIYISARTENGENNPLVVDNMIINNNVFGTGWSGKGGGVYCGEGSEAVFENNVISDNYAEGQSGGMEFWISEVNLINNTIVNNNNTILNNNNITLSGPRPPITLSPITITQFPITLSPVEITLPPIEITFP